MPTFHVVGAGFFYWRKIAPRVSWKEAATEKETEAAFRGISRYGLFQYPGMPPRRPAKPRNEHPGWIHGNEDQTPDAWYNFHIYIWAANFPVGFCFPQFFCCGPTAMIGRLGILNVRLMAKETILLNSSEWKKERKTTQQETALEKMIPPLPFNLLRTWMVTKKLSQGLFSQKLDTAYDQLPLGWKLEYVFLQTPILGLFQACGCAKTTTLHTNTKCVPICPEPEEVSVLSL